MKEGFKFVAILFFTLLCACNEDKLPKDELDEVRFTLYSLNSDKMGIRYDSQGMPNYKDTISLLSCNAILLKEYSYISPDSARYFFEWRDENGNPLSGKPRSWFFTTLVYTDSALVGAGHENILFGYQGYNSTNSEFIQTLKQKKRQLNRWLFLYAKDRKIL